MKYQIKYKLIKFLMVQKYNVIVILYNIHKILKYLLIQKYPDYIVQHGWMKIWLD